MSKPQSNKQLLKLLDDIKKRWPDIPITKENLQKPTHDFVLDFYKRFLAEIEEGTKFVLGYYEDNLNRVEMDPEEIVYLKITKFQNIFAQTNLTFMLGDIYSPTPTRTRVFFELFIHFINFFNVQLNDFERCVSDKLRMKEAVSGLKEERDKLKSDINNAILLKSHLKTEQENLKTEIKTAETNMEEYARNVSSGLKTKFQIQRKELERLKKQVEEKTNSVEKLQAKESKLLEETVTDEEFTELKELLTNLEEEKNSLGDDHVNLDDLLSHINKILRHICECRKAMPEKFNVDLVKNVITRELEQENLECEKRRLLLKLSTQKSLHNHHKQMLKDLQIALDQHKMENLKVKQVLGQEYEALANNFKEQSEEFQTNLKQCTLENENLQIDISKLENSLKRLKEHIEKNYINVCKAEANWFKRVQKQNER